MPTPAPLPSRSSDDVPGLDERGCVACIGVFDGVHRGHRALIDVARQRADEMGLPLVVITFDPHPMAVVGPRSAPSTLTTLEHRVALLLDAGADEVDVLTFDHELADMSPAEFVEDVLVDRLRVRSVVVGENFRFGHRASGTVETLREEGRRWDFSVVPAPLSGEGDVRWSSTRARALIAVGDVASAADVLGRPYRVDGVVVHGDHRGRGLGFPTANLQWAGTPTIPADGVYAGWIVTAGGRLPAATSVGTNPQFDGSVRRIESYAIGVDDLDLYGRAIGVEFVERIRGQQTFDTLDDFIRRMGVDVDEAAGILARDA